HLQRSFKAALGVSPREYIAGCRMKKLRHELQSGHSVTRAMYDAGFGSSRQLYESASSQLGMTPDQYRRGAVAVPIAFTTAATPVGRMLVAATERGVCAVRFADDDAELETGLRREYPFATRRRNDIALVAHVEKLQEMLRGSSKR